MRALTWYFVIFAALAACIGMLALLIVLFEYPISLPASSSPPSSKQEEGKALVIGLVPEYNVFEQRKRYRPLLAYLSTQLGISMTLRSLPQYHAVVEEMGQDRLDGAFFGSYSYVVAHEKAGAAIIARPQWKDGISQYRGYLFTSTELGNIDVPAMKGLRLCLVSEHTTAGHLFPVKYFRQHGVSDLSKYFGRIFYAGSHDAAILAVLNHEADVGACKDTVYKALMQEHPELKDKLRVFAESEAVPSNGLAVSKRIDAQMRSRLENILLHMHESKEGRRVLDEFGAERFLLTTDADYRPVYDMANEIGAGFNPENLSASRPAK